MSWAALKIALGGCPSCGSPEPGLLAAKDAELTRLRATVEASFREGWFARDQTPELRQPCVDSDWNDSDASAAVDPTR